MKQRKQMTSLHFRRKRVHVWILSSSIIVLVASLVFIQIHGVSRGWTTSFSTFFGDSASPLSENGHIFRQEPPAILLKKSMASPPPTTSISPLDPMPLQPIASLIKPALTGEGVWVKLGTAPAPYTTLPLVAKTFLRPDPVRSTAVVTIIAYDTRFLRLHMVAGTTQPGGPLGVYGPGVIPSSDQKGNALLAAFNGGFMYADGHYGMTVGGITYAPPQTGNATIAVTKTGQIMIGAWGVDARLSRTNPNLVAWRQNVWLLIDHGIINPLTQNGSLWGLTVLNQPWAYTWRSGLGLTAQGMLLYSEGNSLSAYTLAQALHAAGAVMAMQTDINHIWVRNFLYTRQHTGTLQITKLDPAMYGTGTEYLTGTFRDFFYLTRSAYIPPILPLNQPPHIR